MDYNSGKITGTLSSDSKVAIQKGISYGAPPVGELRWKAPQPVNSWNGVKVCSDLGLSAIKMFNNRWYGIIMLVKISFSILYVNF